MDRLGRNKIHNPCEHAVRKENQKEKTVPKPHWFGLFVKKIKMRWVFISILEYSLSAGKNGIEILFFLLIFNKISFFISKKIKLFYLRFKKFDKSS